MLERNSEDLWSELEEIKEENKNKKCTELDNLLTLGNYGGMCFNFFFSTEKVINDQLVMLHLSCLQE